MAKSLQPWIQETVIPVALNVSETFKVGNRVLDIHSIVIANETRPLADPRPCLAQKYKEKDAVGVIFAMGNCSGFNDFTKVFPQPFRVEHGDVIHLGVYGDLADVVKMKLLYSVVKLG